jgi:hypothetical protein
MQQTLFLALPRLGIHPGDLLKLGVKIYSYNDHRSAPFSRAFLLGFSTTKLTRVYGADIVMESITLTTLNLRKK